MKRLFMDMAHGGLGRAVKPRVQELDERSREGHEMTPYRGVLWVPITPIWRVIPREAPSLTAGEPSISVRSTRNPRLGERGNLLAHSPTSGQSLGLPNMDQPSR